MTEESVGSADTASCDCVACQKKRGNYVPNGTIHSYSSQPRGGWQCRYTALELNGDVAAVPTFGVELETVTGQSSGHIRRFSEPEPFFTGDRYDASGIDYSAEYNEYRQLLRSWSDRRAAFEQRERDRLRSRALGNLTADEAAALSAPRGLWHAKHDGSVDGPEFASQPASLAYWRHQKPHLSEMFRTLLHGGMRSHEGDQAGLHINIGTNSFADADHLERFATLVTVNRRWSTRMAQRTHSSVSHWSRFDTFGQSLGDWSRSVFRNGYASQDRYCVLNAGNTGRIEFRLPRGTLRTDRFYAKIEWTAAMVEYTRDSLHEVKVTPFCRWAVLQDYPALADYLREFFPLRLTGGEDDDND